MTTSERKGQDDAAHGPVAGSLHESLRFRYMRYGLPAGLTFFIVVAVSLVDGMNFPFALFLATFVLLIAQAAAMATLSVYRVDLMTEVLIARTVLQEIRIPWKRIRTVELVDRKDLAFPRRFVRIAGGGREFFVFESIGQFDKLLEQITSRSTIAPAPMPAWKRAVLLQWGV